MRAAILALLMLALPAWAQAPSVTVTRWQDLAPYIAQQTERLNEYRARIVELETKLAQAEEHISVTATAHDRLLRAIVVRACDYNSKIAGWAGVLTGLEPIELGTGDKALACPEPGQRWYIPYYITEGGPPIPPAQ